MARSPRQDQPGSWHHVVNRGIAKRPLFESGSDIRFFLSRLARQVRKGRIEIHSYCILTTHFHLLVRSPVGELSEALRQAQNAYSKRFNRMHRRDGSLVRGRFFSKPIQDERYWRTLVRYIDHNSERAQVVSRSEDYPFGSAYHYRGGLGPPWLERRRVEREACEVTGEPQFSPKVYASAFGHDWGDGISEIADLVERRMSARSSAEPLTDLVGSSPVEVQRWMERKTLLADGHAPGMPVCSPRTLDRALDHEEENYGPWELERGGSPVLARPKAFNGLAHDLAGLSWRELSERQGVSLMLCRRLGEEHRCLVQGDADYRARTARVVHLALELALGR